MDLWQSLGLNSTTLKPEPLFGTSPSPPSARANIPTGHLQVSWCHREAPAEIHKRRGGMGSAAFSANTLN